MMKVKRESSVPGLAPRRHTHLIDRLAIANGIFSGLALYPQLFKSAFDGVDDSLSLVSFLLIFLNSLVWTAYALHRKLISLFVASFLNAVAAFSILSLVIFS